MGYLGRTPTPSPIDSSDIPDDSITSAKIVSNTIDSTDINTNAITSAEIAAGAVGASKIASAYTKEVQGDINFLAMRLATEKFSKADQFIDTFVDLTGIDTTNSTFEQVTAGYCVGGTISSAASGNVAFSYTGSALSWSVPAGVTTINARIWGAGGGSDHSNNRGGHGGAAVADITTTPGTTLGIVVGHGGGAPSTGGDGGGGGGFSGVFSSTTISQATALLIASGGGGAGDANNCIGGDGNGTTGADGWQGGSSTSRTGKGGTPTAGGAAGAGGTSYGDNCNGFGPSLQPGTALSGGDAGYSCSSAGTRSWNPPVKNTTVQGGGGRGGFEPGGDVGGGGGGGGYFGGGGGAAGDWSDGGAGGGAGSNYADTGTTSNVTHYNGAGLTSGAGWVSSADGTGGEYGGGEAGKVYISYNTSGGLTAGEDLVLQSVSTTASSAPTTADLSVLMENGNGTATLNTDIKGYVSRDGGTTWSQGTLVSGGPWGANKEIISFESLDISTQPSGVSMKYKITTHNQSLSKESRIHSVSLSWE